MRVPSAPMRERDQSNPDAPAEPTLPSIRAFVVQFAAETRDESGVRGRVEHLASGHATRFDSWARLREFVEGCLEEKPIDPPDVRTRGQQRTLGDRRA